MQKLRLIRLAIVLTFFLLATTAPSFGKGYVGAPYNWEAVARRKQLDAIKGQIELLGTVLKKKLDRTRWEPDPKSARKRVIEDVVREFFLLIHKFQELASSHSYKTERVTELYAVFFEGLSQNRLNAPDFPLLWRLRRVYGSGPDKLAKKICELNLVNMLPAPNGPFR